MTHRQHPLGTGFTAASTVDDALAGIDLTGKNVVVTGGHSGLGLVATRALSEAGASVTVGSRDTDRAAAAVAGIERVQVSRLDLMDPASVDAFVARYLESDRPLHILINNAGFLPSAEIVRDARGYEAQLATNHLGHFQLTLGLHPALRAAAGARVVTTTSGAQRFSDILWDDPNFTRGGYDPGLAYAQSKTANVLFTVELDRRWAPEGIRAFAAHPGVVATTSFNSSVGAASQRAQGLIDDAGRPIIDPELGKKTEAQGAATIVFGATSPLLDGLGGLYLIDNDVSRLNDEDLPLTADSVPAEVVSHSIDPRSAERLWALSERLLNVPASS
ncbi:SDR family NAD(P)-dependent oxidoreductase [Promicromonospora iranensis]|uniref:NAD(P)-dependent dehydrogenase (Short-subunit alcohol dehydrogenase family) n=1 Tax=Promicromonospora iranensis TaxID=1105144 RepID=A0ABU2CJK2_9MICO|nr:SDR family NAD(P)-dependent oxidoreductase [Promicromonospora iranensis]MDR7381516.1 NAD(P)-dependent dehydrogenase (short-subunit alcohol dehydrogenase family) [Promicromonospora iranensis]